MMISKRVNRLKNKGRLSDKVVETVVVVMKEMGWSYEETMACPIPSYFVIVKVLSDRAEKEKKEYQKRKGK